MRRRVFVRHLVILLPGIMGSVLQKDGRDIWSLSGQALADGLRAINDQLDSLVLRADDPERETLEDGITASRLIDAPYNVLRLIKSSGYGRIQQELLRASDMTPGDVANPQPNQNFFPFPYDWRRDIRSAAHRLDRFINRQLPAWRSYRRDPDARVILIAHSMGGLVSRYYIECLNGFENVEALYTLGTPHRGSINALDTIINGLHFKKSLLEIPLKRLTTVVRSFSSIYQLLPTYPVVQDGDALALVCDHGALPHLNRARAAEARQLLLHIGESALYRWQEALAHKHLPQATTIPIVGIGQPTRQWMQRLANETFEAYVTPRPGLTVSDGDGTVPHFSAIPVEVQELNLQLPRFVSEYHGWLISGEASLYALKSQFTYQLDRTQFPIQGASDEHLVPLSVKVDDLFATDEAVVITATVAEDPHPGSTVLVAHIKQVDGPIRRRVELHSENDSYVTSIEGLPEGLYELSVRPQIPSPAGPQPVTTAFDVVAP